MGSLVPDGELIFSQDAVLVDLSGIHTLAPSHLEKSPTPGLAMDRRATTKHNKYDSHALSINCLFFALVADAFGSLRQEFVDLLLRIESHALDTRWVSPTRMTLDSFLVRFATEWQASNAAIVSQYTSMCTLRRLRAVPKRLRSCWCGASGWSCAAAGCSPSSLASSSAVHSVGVSHAALAVSSVPAAQ